MTAPSRSPDPRPQLAAALDQAQRQVEEIESAALGRSTPCADYNVQTLLAHLVAVLRKLTTVSKGGDMAQVTDPAGDRPDDWGETFGHERASLEQVWGPDSALSTRYTIAWGTMSGHELLDAYTHEFTVHAWDLAHATGRSDDLDPALAEAALDWYSRNVPAEGRSKDGPFAPAVPVSDDADVYTQLAAFVGRQP